MTLNYVGHVVYDLFHSNGDHFSSSQTFDNFDELYHHISFIHLLNMQVGYDVEEVRIAEVYIQGFSEEATIEVVSHINNQDQPLSDFGLYKSDTMEVANG